MWEGLSLTARIVPEGQAEVSPARSAGYSCLRENRISRTKQNLMGAPCSRQRTWADYEFFECFHSTSNNNGRASPGFPVGFVALIQCMRLSSRKGAHAALSSAACQEIRIARLFRPTYAGANKGHPSGSVWSWRSCSPADALASGVRFSMSPCRGPTLKKTVYLSGYCMRSYQSRPPRACYSDGNEENRLARSPVHQISDF